MNELQFAAKVRQILNHELRLDAQTAERLRAARERALLRQGAETVHDLAWADNVAGRLGGLSGVSVRVLLPLLMVVIGAFAIYTWQQTLRVAETEEIDSRLLTDELPIDAYLDKGFETWLKKRSP